jgi:hypothetical protein
VVRAAARQAAIASSLNQIGSEPRFSRKRRLR